MKSCIRIHPSDNVATMLESVENGDSIAVLDDCLQQVEELSALESIPFGHKIALKALQSGENVVKFGSVIGKATAEISRGSYVHIHNVVSIEGRQKPICSEGENE